jgi:predicted secreted Zn-dependent protease
VNKCARTRPRRVNLALGALVLVLTACGTAPIDSASSGASPYPSLRTPPGIELVATTSTYPIGGATAPALVDAMQAKALRDPSGDAAFALTTWDITWSYAYRERPGACSIDDLAVRADISVVMPSWEPPAEADVDLIADWGRYVDALRRHERGHEENGLGRATDVRDTLLALGARSTCASLEQAADAAGEKIIEAGLEWDRRYDDDTGHGATQGVVFP